MTTKNSTSRITYIKTKDSIIISYGVNAITVHKNDPRFSAIEKCLSEENISGIPGIFEAKDRNKIKNLLLLKK